MRLGFNSELHYIGVLCKRNHDHTGDQHSYRYIKSRSCVECNQMFSAKRYKRDKIEIQSQQRSKKYGIDNAVYQLFFDDQDGCCAICGQHETALDRWGNVKPLAIDHNHQTGQVRGLLCDRCNRGLGYFKDSEENLESALHYLRKSR